MANDFKRGIRIYLETSDYKKGLEDMVASTQKYEKQLSELKKQSEEMTKAGTNTGKAWNQLQRDIARNEKQVQKSLTAEGKYRQQLKETETTLKGLSGATYNQLTKARNALSKELKNAERGTAKYNATLEQHKRVMQEIAKADAQMRSQVGAQGSMFSKAANGINKYMGLAAAFTATITGLSFTFRKLAEDVAKMDDVYSDVMKTTNMTRKEVVELNESFKKIDTRTAREELNMLARDAGKLGITGKKDILDFVEAGNQIHVALGDDLGDGAIKSIGKMVGVFQTSTKELQNLGLKEQMLSAASAVNELGMSSTANEKYLVQFAGRMGGISKQAKISMGDILGFASSLDQDMQAVEMSATALQKFIMKLMAEPAKFAKIAGKDVKEFSALLNTDANEAIKSVLSALNEKGGFQELIPIFKDMGLDGARAVGVLSSLAGSLDQVEKAQDIAKNAMKEGISVTEEYNIKNENLQAQLEKARKRFKEVALELGESLSPMLLKSTKGTTHLIKALVELPKWLKENKGLILTLITVLAAYTLITARATIAENAHTAALKLKNSAFIKLFKTMLTNPYALIGVAVAAATVAIYKFLTHTTEAQKAMEDFNAEAQKESIELNNIFEAYKKANPGTKEKARLLGIIKEKYGPYIKDLIDEEGNISDIAKAQKLANKGLRENIALKIQTTALDDLVTKETKKQAKILNDIREHVAKKKGNDIANVITREIGEIFAENTGDFKAAYTAAWKVLRKYNLSPVLRKGFFAQSLAGDLTDLSQSFMNIENGTKRIRSNFEGIISMTTELVGNEEDDKDDDDNDTPDPTSDDALKAKLAEIDLWQTEESNKMRAYRIEEEISEKQFQDALFGIQAEARLKKMALYEQGSKEYQDLLAQEYDQNIKGNKEYYARLLKATTDAHKAQQTATTEFEQLERTKLQNALNEQLNDETKTLDEKKKAQKQYNDDILLLTAATAEKRLIDAQNFAAIIDTLHFESEEQKKKYTEDAAAEILKAEQNLANAERAIYEQKLKDEADYQARRKAFRDKLGLDEDNSIRGRYKKEKEELEQARKEEFVTEEEHAKAVRDLKLKYAEEYAQGAVMFANQIADAVNAYHQFETDSLEAEKQKQLSLAGDDKEKREKIEQEYAQKELDLKKKQANADAAIKIGQAVAGGALAVIQCFAQLGPVAGGIAAAVVGVTTGFQIASIIKQRNAIMATTLSSGGGSSGGGSSSSPSMGTGARVPITDQAADGRYDVVGKEDGKTYRNVPYRGVARTGVVRNATLVAEQGDELIVDNPTLRNLHMNAPHIIDTIMRYRVPQRASGNYASVETPNNLERTESSANNEAVLMALVAHLQENNKLLSKLMNDPIYTYMILDQFEATLKKRNDSVKRGSL